MRACHCKSTPRTFLFLAEVINMCWVMSKWELNHKCAPGPRAGSLTASLALSLWRDSSHGLASFFWWFLKDFTLSSFVYEQVTLSFPLVLLLPWRRQNPVATYKGILGGLHAWVKQWGCTLHKENERNKMFPISAIYRHGTPWLLIGVYVPFPWESQNS